MPAQNFAFTKEHRLLKPADFKAVFDAPIKKIHSEHCIVFVRVNSHQIPRMGLAITKKKLKQAVMRNQLKRVTREVFRLSQHEIGAVDLVLIVKISFTKEAELYDEISQLFHKIKTLYPKNKS